MKRLTTLVCAGLLTMALIFSFVPITNAATQHFVATVHRMLNTGDTADASTRILSGITYKVLAIDSDTSETLYSDTAGTSKTNPVTSTVYNTQDRVDFYCDPTDASSDRYVDLIVVNESGGYTAFVENFDKYTHKIVIDERANVVHHGTIWFTLASDTETSTGVTFVADTMVLSMQAEVVTVEAGTTMDVGLDSTGTNGSANGFLDGIDVSSAGYIQESVTTSGSFMDSTDFYMSGHAIDGTDDGELTFVAATGSGVAASGYLHYKILRTR